MYRILDNNGNPLNVFSDQLSLADHNEIGFASFAGSKRALESVRQKLVSDKRYDYISFYSASEDNPPENRPRLRALKQQTAEKLKNSRNRWQ